MKLSVVEWTHQFLKNYVSPGDICIDATAGRGMDTLFLCKLVGENGKVFSFDIQAQAIKAGRRNESVHLQRRR